MDIQEYSDVERLKAEVILLSSQMATNIIEIGQRLTDIREKVKHGDWDAWVETNLPFSKRWANQYIRAYKEFGNSSSHLPAKKMFLLLDLPEEEREPFIQQPHELPSGETKTINEMSTREIQAEVKARKEAEKKAKKLERQIADLQNRPEPEPRIIEKEVIPPEAQRQIWEAKTTANQLNKVSDENKRLKLELEALKSNSIDDRTVMEAKVSTFTGRIKEFIRQMSPLGYLGQEVMRTSPKAQKDYENSITALEKWCHDMRDAMIRPKENKIIEVEVIQ
jgi:regulator of replication initiation timing